MDPATPHRTRFESCHPHRGQCGPAALSGASQRPPPSTSFACILDFPWEPAFAAYGLRGKPGPAARGHTHSPGPTPHAMVTVTGASTGPQDNRAPPSLVCQRKVFFPGCWPSGREGSLKPAASLPPPEQGQLWGWEDITLLRAFAPFPDALNLWASQ